MAETSKPGVYLLAIPILILNRSKQKTCEFVLFGRHKYFPTIQGKQVLKGKKAVIKKEIILQKVKH